jgi:hypothetical protein
VGAEERRKVCDVFDFVGEGDYPGDWLVAYGN